MDSENHLTFVFIFMLMVIAIIIGEANNQALNHREKAQLTQTRQVSQPSELR